MTAAVLNITVNAVNDVPVATGNTVIAAEDRAGGHWRGRLQLHVDVEHWRPPHGLGDHHTGLTLNGGTLDASLGGHGPGDQRHDGDRWRELADLTFTSALERRHQLQLSPTRSMMRDAGIGDRRRSVNITVNAANDVPVATGNTVIAAEDVPLVIGAGAFSFTDCGRRPPVLGDHHGLTLNGGTS